MALNRLSRIQKPERNKIQDFHSGKGFIID